MQDKFVFRWYFFSQRRQGAAFLCQFVPLKRPELPTDRHSPGRYDESLPQKLFPCADKAATTSAAPPRRSGAVRAAPWRPLSGSGPTEAPGPTVLPARPAARSPPRSQNRRSKMTSSIFALSLGAEHGGGQQGRNVGGEPGTPVKTSPPRTAARNGPPRPGLRPAPQCGPFVPEFPAPVHRARAGIR